jgi:uncharacterized membrane protein
MKISRTIRSLSIWGLFFAATGAIAQLNTAYQAERIPALTLTSENYRGTAYTPQVLDNNGVIWGTDHNFPAGRYDYGSTLYGFRWQDGVAQRVVQPLFGYSNDMLLDASEAGAVIYGGRVLSVSSNGTLVVGPYGRYFSDRDPERQLTLSHPSLGLWRPTSPGATAVDFSETRMLDATAAENQYILAAKNNDQGVIVGAVRRDSQSLDSQAFVAGVDGGPLELLSIPGASSSWLQDINNAGLAVGTMTLVTGESHVFTFDTTTRAVNDLGMDPDTLNGDRLKINLSGQIIIGEYIHDSASGQWFKPVVDFELGTDTLELKDINDAGVILAATSRDTYLLSAVPEPGTWALMALGLVAVGLGSRRHQA